MRGGEAPALPLHVVAHLRRDGVRRAHGQLRGVADVAAAHQDVVARLTARIAFFQQSAVPNCDKLRPDPRSDPRLHGGAWAPWSNDTRPGCPESPTPAPPSPPPTPPPPGCIAADFLADTDFKDGSGLGRAPAANAEACCALCASAAWAAKGCKYFTFVPAGQPSDGSTGCWLQANDDGRSAHAGATSGAVVQP